jgi:hypothetical protein
MTGSGSIGYYVHHHGRGHVTRATTIAAACRSEVVGFSTLPRPDSWPGPWVRLPDDSAGVDTQRDDVTAGGTLHWVPRGHRGLAARAGLVSAALARGRVRVLVVDVSVEIAVLARLHGVPVVVMAQPGERTDRAHRTAYDLAERLLAPWPPRPAPDWPDHWQDKTVHLGTVSRFDGLPTTTPPARRRVLALWGGGGTDVGVEALRAAAAATPGWTWQVAGPPPDPGPHPPDLEWTGWAEDVWALLGAADVVVTHAGQNAIAEVAAARRAAVVVPQRRPFGEQAATGRALAASGTATVVERWPEPSAWAELLGRAAAAGGDGWKAWSDGRGAERAAAVLDGMAEGGR